MQIDKVGGHTRVALDMPLWKGEERQRFRVYSSVYDARPLVEGEWADGVAKRVAKRLKDNGGDDKGRVVYVGRALGDGARSPLAVVAWHLPPDDHPDEPLEILDMDVAKAVEEADAAWVAPLGNTLMAALRAIAGHPKVARPNDRLAWVTDEKSVVARAWELWKFGFLPTGKHPPHNRAKHYGRRIEP